MRFPAPLPALLACALSCGACGDSPEAVPTPPEAKQDQGTVSLGAPEPMGAAEALVTADFDGDGLDEVIRVEGGTLTGPWGDFPLPGSFQLGEAGVLGEGPGETLVVVTGMGRGHREEPLRVFTSTGGTPELLWERPGARNQATDLRFVDGRLWLVAFVDAWQATGGWLEDGQLSAVSTARLGMSQLPRPDGSVVISRLYGDQPKSDGMLLLRSPDGAERPLPSLRGARALTAADLDGDGADELLLGDGWHFQYGERALARVQLLEGPTWSPGRTIAMLPGDYAVNHLEVERLPDGRPVVLASGSAGAALLVPDALGWGLLEAGSLGDETARATFLHTAAGLSVLLPGPQAVQLPVVVSSP